VKILLPIARRVGRATPGIWLDRFVESVLIPEYTRGEIRAFNPEYKRVQQQIVRARRRGDRDTVRQLRKQLRGLPSVDPQDPG
jgi:hypothetical protein